MKIYKFMYVYKITCNINNKIYIGSHRTNDENDKYFGSGLLIKRAITKYDLTNFTKDILEYCTSIEEMKRREEYYIQYYNSTEQSIGYNITKFACGGQPITDEVRLKISNALKGIKRSEETKALMKKPKGPRSKEHTEKLKLTLIGRQWWYDPLTNISRQFKADENIPPNYIKGRPSEHIEGTKTIEARLKQGKTLSNNERSEEHKQKLSESMQNVWKERKLSGEDKIIADKISNTLKMSWKLKEN